MNWRVVKMGTEMFDMLHTYGLGVVIAHATQASVQIQDEGCFYRLTSLCSVLPPTSLDVLDELLLLPASQEVLHLSEKHSSEKSPSLAVANLDGLLAALFTNSQGVRACSVWSLLQRQRFDPSVIERTLLKIKRMCTTWKEWIQRHVDSPSCWLEEVLDGYDLLQPCYPLPVIKQRGAITVPMTLEPSLSYASRQSQSDGRIAQKSNMTIAGTRFAPVLAYIGAMRFLRAQPVAGDLIAYTLPLVAESTIERWCRRPVLRPRGDDEPEAALVMQWLGLTTLDVPDEGRVRGLAFQILQAQGKQSAISRSRGMMELSWLVALTSSVGISLVRHWQWVLSFSPQECPYERHALVHALFARQRHSWEAHLFEVAQTKPGRNQPMNSGTPEKQVRVYSVDEVRKVVQAMEGSSPSPLSCVLERKEGTLRFGHALRQLKHASAPSNVREFLEELASVRTREYLLDILTRLMEICEVMDAKTYFLIIPSDDDLKGLLEDVEQYGTHTVAEILRLLSTLRYPAKADEMNMRNDSNDLGIPT